MKIIGRALVLGGTLLCLLLLSPAVVRSQQVPPRSYLFVEVKDTRGKALDEAAVAFSGLRGDIKTNKEGIAESSFGLQWGAHHYDLRVSKPGYLTAEDVLFAVRGPYAGEEFPVLSEYFYGPKPPPLRVVLPEVPSTPAERRAFEAADRQWQLLLAVKRGEAASLRRLLAAGVRADTADARGVPAIAWAAFAGDAETIEVLLAAGVDVRLRDGPGHRALLLYLTEGIERDPKTRSGVSAVGRHEEVVRKLVEAGAGVNARDASGRTVLNSAIARTPYFGQPPHSLTAGTVRLLVAAGASVNAADAEGRTPLMTAASQGSAELVRLLLAAGASVGAKDKRGRTALMYAEGHSSADSSLEAARLLLAAGARADEADAEGQTPLMRAARRHFVGAIKMLLAAGAGASVNARDARGRTALLHVERELYNDASTEMTRLLVAAGADPNVADEEGRTPLMSAAGNQEALKTLLEAGARRTVNAKDRAGRTALMHTAYVDSLKLLLEAGAAIDARDARGATALMHAASTYSAPEAVKLLTSAGAKVNDVDADGRTALMLAASTPRGDASRLVIRALLAAGADVNAADNEGRTALMALAAAADDVESVKALLAAGAEVNVVDKKGRTPIALAREAGNLSVLGLLEEAAARR